MDRKFIIIVSTVCNIESQKNKMQKKSGSGS